MMVERMRSTCLKPCESAQPKHASGHTIQISRQSDGTSFHRDAPTRPPQDSSWNPIHPGRLRFDRNQCIPDETHVHSRKHRQFPSPSWPRNASERLRRRPGAIPRPKGKQCRTRHARLTVARFQQKGQPGRCRQLTYHIPRRGKPYSALHSSLMTRIHGC